MRLLTHAVLLERSTPRGWHTFVPAAIGPDVCPACGGRGEHEVWYGLGASAFQGQPEPCDRCHGGMVERVTWWRCVGCHGHVPHPDAWETLGALCRGFLVPIPAVTSPPHAPPPPPGRLF